MRKKRLKQRGFGLIELMVVCSIVGILIAMGLARTKVLQARAKQQEAKVNLKSVYSLFKAATAENDTLVFAVDPCLSNADSSTSTSCQRNNQLGFKLTDCRQVRYFYMGLNAVEFKTGGRSAIYDISCGDSDSWSVRLGNVTSLYDSTRHACGTQFGILQAEWSANVGSVSALGDYNGDGTTDTADFDLLDRTFNGPVCN